MRMNLVALAAAASIVLTANAFAQPGTGKMIEAGGVGELVTLTATFRLWIRRSAS